MTYIREIPRDLFNEANLLKCYGQIWLNLEKLPRAPAALQKAGKSSDEFVIVQDSSDGSTWILNVHLVVRGDRCTLRRPLNSREPWPLYLTIPGTETEIDVFNRDGSFSPDMREFLERL